jgi:hypothetical protein
MSAFRKWVYMLIEFRVKNFRSFRDEQIFTMIASSDKDLPNNVAITPSIDHTPVVKSAVVLGANASGKSNLIVAMGAPFRLVLNQHKTALREIDTFLLDQDSAHHPSEFCYEFVVDSVRYLYKVALRHDTIWWEELTSYPKRVPRLLFRRVIHQNTVPNAETQGEKYNREFGNKLRLINSITPHTGLLLASIANTNLAPFTQVWAWIQTQFLFTSNHTLPDSIEKDDAERLAEKLNEDAYFRNFVLELVRAADLGVTNIISEPIEALTQDLSKTLGLPRSRYKLFFDHFEEGDEDNPAPFSFAQQSVGTQQLLRLAMPLYDAFQYGKVLIVDELDSSLHPHLVRYLITLFHTPSVNRHNAQLIFNTHDATLLDTGLFRRDQIWFTEKENDGASTLFPLTAFSPRRGEALVRGYMVGRYGAIPILGDPESLIPPFVVASAKGHSDKRIAEIVNGGDNYGEA